MDDRFEGAEGVGVQDGAQQFIDRAIPSMHDESTTVAAKTPATSNRWADQKANVNGVPSNHTATDTPNHAKPRPTIAYRAS
jgi:hypothetical protein